MALPKVRKWMQLPLSLLLHLRPLLLPMMVLRVKRLPATLWVQRNGVK